VGLAAAAPVDVPSQPLKLAPKQLSLTVDFIFYTVWCRAVEEFADRSPHDTAACTRLIKIGASTLGTLHPAFAASMRTVIGTMILAQIERQFVYRTAMRDRDSPRPRTTRSSSA